MTQAANLREDETTGGAGASLPVPGVGRLTDSWRRMRQFLHETRNEMRRVTWPSWDDVVSTTIVVTIAVAFFGVFFWVVDSGLAYFENWVFKFFKH